MAEKVTAMARVRLTVEVTVPDTWGNDCTVAQVHGQATESAIRIVGKFASQVGARLVGTPTVDMITTGAATITPAPEGR